MQLFINDTASISGSVTSLPAYTRRESPPPRFPTQHVFQLSHNLSDKRNSKPWITLYLISNSRDPKSLPTYVEGDKITGSVELDLEEAGDNIQSVKVIVRGDLTNGYDAQERTTFLELTQTLWCKSTEDSGRTSGRLLGHNRWAFSVSLPKTVTIPGSPVDDRRQFPLPPTVVERYTRASVRYDLIVHVVRSKFRYNSSLSTTFVYIPATRPAPPSPLRQLAYQDSSPIIGPETDPEGWNTLPPVKIQGSLFNARNIEVVCHLSLAKPLCYTRGSVIPLSLLLSSADSQALDLFSVRPAIDVRLRRQVHCRHELVRAEINRPIGMLGFTKKTKNQSSEDSALAVWWLSPEGCREAGDGLVSRRMHGELSLPTSLKPSCEISHFRICYTVALFPFDTPGFQVSSLDQTNINLEPLLEQQVNIATVLPRGPRPISYAPPDAAGCRRGKPVRPSSACRPSSAHVRRP
ncbi:hypothetical protein E1B28_011085 [Marasmius oreades]|uniref:Arrestin-like N-terminal domain-containing protein n=1 Tax=Marasmius oreades TaxID=181124 RepID=A0A9P7RTI9_9AGAR|nr:uncharacterized protein E1B28_011085 [Marasmius oreades]KAG7089397.1 hypothetical protein E1B28_011085 [Marasmius oreades]